MTNQKNNSRDQRHKKALRSMIRVDRFIASAVSKFEKVPFFGPLLYKFWQNLRSFARSVYMRGKSLQFLSPKRLRAVRQNDLNTIHFLSPNDIVFVSHLEEINREKKRIILRGDWDRLNVRFDDLNVVTAVNQVIINNKKWEDTDYYRDQKSRGKYEENTLDCPTEVDIFNLYNNLKQLDDHNYDADEISKEVFINLFKGKEILINIGRFGDLLLHKGECSLAIAKLIGLEKIPVKIVYRHSEWMKFRQRYELFALGRGSKAYQPAQHIDLMHIPAQQGCVERHEIIKKNLSISKGRLLDLGANLGYFCIKFENEGFDCVAVENSPRFAYCLKGIKRALNKNFEIVTDSLLDSQEVLAEPFDVVLALNIFHHLLKREETFHKLEHFLGQLKCKECYFEPHLFDDPQMSESYINFHEDEFAEFVRKNLNLGKSELIGKASDNRPIYKIT